MASFSFDSVLFSLTSLYPYFTSVSRNLTLTKSRWTLVADSRWDSAACRWIYKNRRIPYYVASSIQYSDFLSSNVSSRESLNEFGQILREFIGFYSQTDESGQWDCLVQLWTFETWISTWSFENRENKNFYFSH